MIRSAGLALLAALFLAAPAAAQGDGSGRGGGGRGIMMAPAENSVAWILTQHARFAAEPAQVAGLQALAGKFDADNAALKQQIDKLRPSPGTDPRTLNEAERDLLAEKRFQLRSLIHEWRARDDAAIAKALELLNEEQKTRVAALLEKHRAELMPARPGGQ